jgi:hypothetical protein
LRAAGWALRCAVVFTAANASAGRRSRRHRGTHRRPHRRPRQTGRGARFDHSEGPCDRLGYFIPRPRDPRAHGHFRCLAFVQRRPRMCASAMPSDQRSPVRVFRFGDASSFGSFPAIGVHPTHSVIGLVLQPACIGECDPVGTSSAPRLAQNLLRPTVSRGVSSSTVMTDTIRVDQAPNGLPGHR